MSKQIIEEGDLETEDEDAVKRPRFQISLGTMLLLTTVFAVMSAGLLYASRIPAIDQELASMFGQSGSVTGSNRMVQIVFIMFTYSMPLLMAGVLATMSTIWNWLNRNE